MWRLRELKFTVIRSLGTLLGGRPRGRGVEGTATSRVCASPPAVATEFVTSTSFDGVGDAGCSVGAAGTDRSSSAGGATVSQNPPMPLRFFGVLLMVDDLPHEARIVLRSRALGCIGIKIVGTAMCLLHLNIAPDLCGKHLAGEVLLEQGLHIPGDIRAVVHCHEQAAERELRSNAALHLGNRLVKLQYTGEGEDAGRDRDQDL